MKIYVTGLQLLTLLGLATMFSTSNATLLFSDSEANNTQGSTIEITTPNLQGTEFNILKEFVGLDPVEISAEIIATGTWTFTETITNTSADVWESFEFSLGLTGLDQNDQPVLQFESAVGGPFSNFDGIGTDRLFLNRGTVGMMESFSIELTASLSGVDGGEILTITEQAGAGAVIIDPVPVPEPTSLALIGLALLGMGFSRGTRST